MHHGTSTRRRPTAALAAAAALGGALLLVAAPARGQCDADAGPTDGLQPGDLRDTFPADGDLGVPTDAVVRLRFVAEVPAGTAIVVAEEGGAAVMGRAVVVGSDLVWHPAAELRADAPYAAQVSGGPDATFTLRFRTGLGPARTPPTFGGVTAVSARAEAADCDPGAQNITVEFNRAAPPVGADGWPAADVEYVVYETRGPGIAGPRERDRARLQSSGSDLDRSAQRTFRLSAQQSSGPVCFNVQAIDPNGRADGNAVESCVNPAAGNFFAGCAASPRSAGSGRALLAGLAGLAWAVRRGRARRRDRADGSDRRDL